MSTSTVLRVPCPGCGKELKARPELVGKMVACPRCSTQFPITNTGSVENATMEDGESVSPPPPPLPGDPASHGSNDYAIGQVPIAQPAASDSAVLPPPVASPVPPDSASRGPQAPTPSGLRKQPKRAKFVSADPTATRINLGEDGQLPELKLQEAETKKKEQATEETSTSSNRWLIVGVMAFSVLASVGMLVLPSQSGPKKSNVKEEARQHLIQYYTNEPSEPYQMLLRQAMQANSRGDFARERAMYRRVLDMLHQEGKNKAKGLTGVISKNNPPPNDEDLESWLNRLLSSR